LGIAIVEITAIIMTTINNSTSEKALFLVFISNKYWQEQEDFYPCDPKNLNAIKLPFPIRSDCVHLRSVVSDMALPMDRPEAAKYGTLKTICISGLDYLDGLPVEATTNLVACDAEPLQMKTEPANVEDSE